MECWTFVLQQLALQQQQQQQQLASQQPGSGSGSGQPSGQSGNSQPGSLDSLLNYMGTLPISSLINAIDTNTIQSFLEPGISLSSGDGGSNSMADVSVGNQPNGQSDQQPHSGPDFQQVQQAIQSLNKTS